MNKTIHPMEPEELMAYLDGELAAERAGAVEVHLSECGECQGVVSGLRSVSQELHTWKVEIPVSNLPERITSALGVRGKSHGTRKGQWNFRELFSKTSGSMAWAGGLAALVIVGILGITRFVGSNRAFMQVGQSVDNARVASPASDVESAGQGGLRPSPPPPSAAPQSRQFDRLEQFAKLATKFRARLGDEVAPASDAAASAGPMIIRTAELALTTKEFDKARAGIEGILKRHRGYMAGLKVGGAVGSGRNLTGTLRVPADQLDATLSELKTLGRVESESQGGQDVTSQFVDLQARLANARNTEKRLTDILNQRTGKLSDVLEVEREVDRVRGQIEQMEAERKNMSNQVSFATLNVTVSEDYKAQLEVVPPSTFTRLSNASVEGYRSMVDGVVGVMLFLLSSGPSVLLWGAILFLPARFAWRKLRRAV
jgi:hypothetical protein